MLTPKKFFKKITRFLNKGTSKQSNPDIARVPQLDMGNQLNVAPISITDCPSPKPETIPSTGSSFALIASDSSSDSTAGFACLSTGYDQSNERTVEFIAKIFNSKHLSINHRSTELADSATHHSDSDSWDEDGDEDGDVDDDPAVIEYLESVNQMRTPDDDPAVIDSKLAQIVRVLNAAKFRRLSEDRQAKSSSMIAEPSKSSQLSPTLPQIGQLTSPKLQDAYQEDFPELSTSWKPAPHKPTPQVDSLIGDFTQKLNLITPTSSGAGLSESAALPGSVAWKPSFFGDSLWKPVQIGEGSEIGAEEQIEEDQEEDYRNANIQIETNKCHYCKLDEPKFVLKCSECPIYFCNSKGRVSYERFVGFVFFKLTRSLSEPPGFFLPYFDSSPEVRSHRDRVRT